MSNAPRPTTDMARMKADLAEHGYGIFEGAIDPDTTAAIRDRVLEQAAAERRGNVVTSNVAVEPEDAVNQWVAFLPNKGKIHRALINNPHVLEIVRYVLGQDAILSEFSAHITWPDNEEMALHIDQWFMPQPMMPGEDYERPANAHRADRLCGDPVEANHPIPPPVVCNAMVAITDFTLENGATRLVPGSHLSGRNPAPDTDYDVTFAEAPAGSLVVWEGRTWHAASLNTGTTPRVGITTYWAAPFLRQLLNFTYGLRPEVTADLSDQERALMGFKPWSTYGTSDEFGADWARPGKDNVGELK
ncbi:MAG: hypothetical protein CMM46_17555 [Rhodospirillaceae bacterium]|nr:hypothetical protein [Rhodospirillaceae bacterium]